MKHLVRAVAGLAIVLAWWTLHGSPDGSTAQVADRIPAVVWEGGAGSLTIRTETTCPAKVRVSFNDRDDGDDKEPPRRLESWEAVPAGSHSWTIDVPAQVGGYVELEADSPHPGDRLTWKIEAGGSIVDQQSDTLERALEPGTAFFLQSYFDDYANGSLGQG